MKTRARLKALTNASLLALLAASLCPVLINTASAEDQVFDAICLPEKKKCSFKVSPERFDFGNNQIILVRRVTSWGKAGKGTRPDLGMAALSAAITPVMPLAVFGLFKSKHEYIFDIDYVDSQGSQQKKSIKFLNKKPQDRFSDYLGTITGLAENSATGKPLQLFRQNKAATESNLYGVELVKYSIYQYSASCDINVSYSCLAGIQSNWPTIINVPEF